MGDDTGSDGQVSATELEAEVTKLRNRQIFARRSAGLPLSVIAVEFGLSVSWVHQITCRMGVPRQQRPRKHTAAKEAGEARNREMLARCAAGETFAAVGASYGLSKERVRQIVRGLGLTSRANWFEWTEDDRALLRQLWHEGLSIEAIAARLGVSRHSVTSKRCRLGLPVRSPQQARPQPRKLGIA